ASVFRAMTQKLSWGRTSHVPGDADATGAGGGWSSSWMLAVWSPSSWASGGADSGRTTATNCTAVGVAPGATVAIAAAAAARAAASPASQVSKGTSCRSSVVAVAVIGPDLTTRTSTFQALSCSSALLPSAHLSGGGLDRVHDGAVGGPGQGAGEDVAHAAVGR